jgi:hypothetical protein
MQLPNFLMCVPLLSTTMSLRRACPAARRSPPDLTTSLFDCMSHSKLRTGEREGAGYLVNCACPGSGISWPLYPQDSHQQPSNQKPERPECCLLGERLPARGKKTATLFNECRVHQAVFSSHAT